MDWTADSTGISDDITEIGVLQSPCDRDDRDPILSVDEPSDGYVVVRVRGDLDVVTAPELGSCLSECIISPSTVLLDLRAVPFVGCAALAVIAAAGAFLDSRGERLIVACNRSTQRALQVSGVSAAVTVQCV